MEPVVKTEKDMQEILLELMALAGFPAHEIPSPEKVQEAVVKLKQKLATSSSIPERGHATASASAQQKAVLIAGQTGIIVHQLRQELKKLDADITLAKHMEAAIELFPTQVFSMVILDLFMPTEREGLIVLDEIQRIRKDALTHVIVLAPPCRDQNLQGRCIAKGASHFLEKVDGWQKSILDIYQSDFGTTPQPEAMP